MRSSGTVLFVMIIVLFTRMELIAKNENPNLVFVENEFIRVGINLKWGGAITHVSKAGGPNLINSYDLGRQIQ